MKDPKKLISLRLDDLDRAAVQLMATRLLVRESDIYRLAISYFLNKLNGLLAEYQESSEILLALVDIRRELIHPLGMQRLHLQRIINTNILLEEHYVAMSDIELLLMPDHLLKNKLIQLYGEYGTTYDIDTYLKRYFIKKYGLKPLEYLE